MVSNHFYEENKKLICGMEKAALAASCSMLETIHSDQDLKIVRKPDNSIVMNLDLDSQEVISSVLGEMLPIISEEDEASHALLDQENDFFLVDPLDGTTPCRRFLKIEGGQVGFGPIIGLVREGRLKACCYFNLPTRTLFSAIEGLGAFYCKGDLLSFEDVTPLDLRRKLLIETAEPLNKSALLFDGRTLPEMRIVCCLKREAVIETYYRFSGFGNDCSRLAQGLEQLSLHLSPKAWDFSAILLAAEAGLQVIVDPLNLAVDYREWKIKDSNPVLIGHADVVQEILSEVQSVSLD